jgi:transcriptional regulator with XRE-family HTH domain
MKLEAIFGTVVREQRLLKNLSQVELSELCGLDRTFISLVERGVRQPTLKSLFQISKGLGLEPSAILLIVQRRLRQTRWKRLKSG